ncbi:hypothetical protein MNEG_16821 (mitochondrion) [Monoraphidium neglectum]|uniref:Uncharacterized protein n=1 Tax=Monoraphidium neglectum TaxID=145388 RepID=A0A0D2LNV4_9CHLO|nr:hypothetical protein MNEG_16821 [Monoraphidium neglectum]KIZ07964.1 hypothetical protein MNEG_16821 [Monoraphidium neglectum]|eukprot:XP_013906983.1 hypothetical protein MNEG_16821 (mitochondrion) [Monoraphidium neglectum]
MASRMNRKIQSGSSTLGKHACRSSTNSSSNCFGVSPCPLCQHPCWSTCDCTRSWLVNGTIWVRSDCLRAAKRSVLFARQFLPSRSP